MDGSETHSAQALPRYQWLTTVPNPRVRGFGADAGQRGWKLHAVLCAVGWKLPGRYENAVCGMRPGHGWGLDLFIDNECKRCARVVMSCLWDAPVRAEREKR